MAIDEMIKKAVLAKPRKFVNERVLWSVVQQESEGCSTFIRTDHQYKQNMITAIKLTGKTEEEILKLVTLPTGKIAKFRLEGSAYLRSDFKKLPFETRFYLSTSFGLCQKMGYLLVNKKYDSVWVKGTVMGFANQEALQLLYGAGDMDNGMQRAFLSPAVTKKDLKTLTYHGYSAFNSGSIIPKKADVAKRCQEVVSRL